MIGSSPAAELFPVATHDSNQDETESTGSDEGVGRVQEMGERPGPVLQPALGGFYSIVPPNTPPRTPPRTPGGRVRPPSFPRSGFGSYTYRGEVGSSLLSRQQDIEEDDHDEEEEEDGRRLAERLKESGWTAAAGATGALAAMASSASRSGDSREKRREGKQEDLMAVEGRPPKSRGPQTRTYPNVSEMGWLRRGDRLAIPVSVPEVEDMGSHSGSGSGSGSGSSGMGTTSSSNPSHRSAGTGNGGEKHSRSSRDAESTVSMDGSPNPSQLFFNNREFHCFLSLSKQPHSNVNLHP